MPKEQIRNVTDIIVACCSLAGIVGAFVLLPYRMTAQEERSSRIEARQDKAEERSDKLSDNSIRMEERVFSIQRQLGIKADPPTITSSK